jgi:hypothetical protein
MAGAMFPQNVNGSILLDGIVAALFLIFVDVQTGRCAAEEILIITSKSLNR